LGPHDGALVRQAVNVLTAGGLSVSAIATTGPQSAAAIAHAEIARGADLILAAGGDGTINEVAEGMVHSSVPLAILPGGTANVLATELKMGSNLLRAARRLGECRPHRIPLGHLTSEGGRISRHFLMMAGAGLDARIVYHVNGTLKARIGKLAYWIAGWSLLGRRLAEFQVTVNGGERRCSFALVSKVRNYGGDFEIARNVSLFDDQFEVVLFSGRSTLPYVKYFGGLALNHLKGMKGVAVMRARHARLSCAEDSRIYVQIDGEFAGQLPAEIRMVPDALTLLVPPEYARLHEKK
jgi:YegS/Rv2252/BmrU family lipid kinase